MTRSTDLRWFEGWAVRRTIGLVGAWVCPLLVACSETRLPYGSPGTLRPGAATECIVSRVVDGDTLVCDDGRRVRLLLIDAPEMDQGEFGAIARGALEALTPPGTEVSLQADVDPLDPYDRTLAYVMAPNGDLVNESLLRSGMAVVAVYPPNVRHVDRFRAASDEARTAGRGIWALNGFECLPSDFRSGACEGP